MEFACTQYSNRVQNKEENVVSSMVIFWKKAEIKNTLRLLYIPFTILEMYHKI